MNRISALRSFFVGAASLVIFYVCIRLMLTPDQLLIILNGLLGGALVAVGVAYWRLVFSAIGGERPYTDVWQMTFSFALLWFYVAITTYNSIGIHALGDPRPVNDATPIARYIAILAACFSVTAPDFGLGIFHGRDRKVLWASITIGLAVSAVLIAAQQFGGNA